MRNNKLPIPALTEGTIDLHPQGLVDYGLNKEIAVFILGSFVYQTANTEGERRFSRVITEIPGFELYKLYFLKNNMLVQGSKAGTYKYDYELDWERYLENYTFDSIVVDRILSKEFPNFSEHFENAFNFLEPNFQRSELPF